MQTDRTLRALADRIKELRDQKGISQELAHRAGLSRTGMGFLETGKRWPRLDTLMKVADGLGVTVDRVAEERPQTFQKTLKGARLVRAIQATRTLRRLQPTKLSRRMKQQG